MRVRIQKTPINLAAQVPATHVPAYLTPQDTVAQPIMTAPPTNTTPELPPTSRELQLPLTSAPRSSSTNTIKNGQTDVKNPNYYKFDQDDSCPQNWLQPRRNRRVGDIESIQPSVV